MTTTLDTARAAPSSAASAGASAAASLQAAIDQACARIAPTWPLDRFIAVNPYWGHLERPIADVAARLAVLSGSPMLMSRDAFRQRWQAGQMGRQHVQAAITAAASTETVDTLLSSLDSQPALPARLPLATDLVDAHRDLGHAMAWRDYITHHISQCCAAFFDQGQATWGPDRSGGLYPSWLRQSAHDLGPGMLMGYPGFSPRLARLPRTPQALIAAAVQALQVPAEAHEAYFNALLMSINGWASWCGYQRWQARLEQRDDAQIVHLLAVRLAWEWLLHDGYASLGVAPALAAAWHGSQRCVAQARRAQQTDWLWQAALERSYQETLCKGLHRAPAAVAAVAAAEAAGERAAISASSAASSGASSVASSAAPSIAPSVAPPAVQAVFCIDVRSEVYRRALEAASPDVQTLGFAGFFAMFVAYQPLGSDMQRPQLPGLLAPGLCITDECDAPGLGQALARQRRKRLQWRQQWQAFRSGAGSSFSFVESCGLLSAGKLLRKSLGGEEAPVAVEQTGLSAAQRSQLRPRYPLAGGPDAEARVSTAATALGAMGLTADHARLVLLAGHGSTSANNPHAAGLDCGACGGQTGEVNARALALLLNEPQVRLGLQDRGVVVPESTWFLAGLHNTTTDDLLLFDTDLLPASHAADLSRLQTWLADAGRRARAERAASLGLERCAADAGALAQAVHARSTDWAQVRPEWGLADCASFIVAPRNRSKHLNLAGRSFLHDYAWHSDKGFGVLELIMTAPMVVTNWINLQYHASTVDNTRYGSGDKVLHNVVGGNIGVFEGNGGDLRVGLPMQSLHDGQHWRHTPLRLSVFIQAPQAAIDDVVARNQTVRHLLDNEWLHLFRLGDASGVWRYRPGGAWVSADMP